MKRLIFFFLIIISFNSYSQSNLPEDFKPFWDKFRSAYAKNDFQSFAKLAKSPIIFSYYTDGAYKNLSLSSSELKTNSTYYFENEDLKIIINNFYENYSPETESKTGGYLSGSLKKEGESIVLDMMVDWFDGIDSYLFTFEKVDGSYKLVKVMYDSF